MVAKVFILYLHFKWILIGAGFKTLLQLLCYTVCFLPDLAAIYFRSLFQPLDNAWMNNEEMNDLRQQTTVITTRTLELMFSSLYRRAGQWSSQPDVCVFLERKMWMCSLLYLTPPPTHPPIRLWSRWDCVGITLRRSQPPVSGNALSSGPSIFPGTSWASRSTLLIHTASCY